MEGLRLIFIRLATRSPTRDFEERRAVAMSRLVLISQASIIGRVSEMRQGQGGDRIRQVFRLLEEDLNW